MKEFLLEFIKHHSNSVYLLSHALKVTEEMRNTIQSLWDQQFIDNAFTVIIVLNNFTIPIDDLEERINLERIYYEILTEVVANRKEK